jgi:hypothetical protein
VAATSKIGHRHVLAREREEKAFQLRKKGFSFKYIGAELGICTQAARESVRRALKRIEESIEKNGPRVRAMEEARLDDLWRKAYVKVDPDAPADTCPTCGHSAETPDWNAFDRCLKVIDQRSKLHQFAWKQLTDQTDMMHRDQALAMVSQVVDIIRRECPDPDVMQRIAAGIMTMPLLASAPRMAAEVIDAPSLGSPTDSEQPAEPGESDGPDRQPAESNA